MSTLKHVLFGAAMAMLPLTVVAHAEDEVRIQVNYSFTAVRIATGERGPIPVRWSVGATLLGSNRVIDSYEGSAGSLRSAGGGQARLGSKWRVLGEHQLERVTEWPNSQTLLRVTVRGKTCSATIESRLRPGRTVFIFRRMDGSMAEFRDPEYTEISCSIS